MSISKISVDLNLRTFEIEVPNADVEPVLALLTNLFSQVPPSALNRPVPAPENEDLGSATADTDGDADNEKPKRKRGSGKSGTKLKAPELMELALDANQRQDIVTFFNDRAPVGQNDQVAVLGVSLKKHLGKGTFNVDEIHSAFKIVQKRTPKNLMAVFGNMKRDGKAGYSNSYLEVNSFTEDHVSLYMKSKKTGDK